MLRNLFLFPVWLATACLGLSLQGLGQKAGFAGIYGRVTDESGKPVPFATIGVEKSGTGTMAAENGSYELNLGPGDWTVVFHCLGYETVFRNIHISEPGERQEQAVTLREQILQTQDIRVLSRAEDPAYAIMRKAIARARLNKLRIDAYEADVYIKGSARITHLPAILRGMAKKQGVDENTVFFLETMEKLSFRQPNQYKERVIASRSTFGRMNIQQNFLKSELYNPEYGGSVSPLAPQAFRYYRFQYLGSFQDRGHEVFKIKVSARNTGEGYWEGELFILDVYWGLHSARLTREDDDSRVTLTQTYSPVDGVWMLIQNKQEIKGKAFGITIEGVYFSQIRQYVITRNARLEASFRALEEQLETRAATLRQKPEIREKDLRRTDREDKKALRKLARAFLKEKIRSRKTRTDFPPPPAPVDSDVEYVVDSGASGKDSIFWLENRAVPLTPMEIRSYFRLDSLQRDEEKKDSVQNKRKGARSKFLLVMLAGTRKDWGKPDSLGRKPFRLKQFSPLMQLAFNAVEGFAMDESLWLQYFPQPSRSRLSDNRPYVQAGTNIRYSFARKRLLASGVLQYARPGWEIQLSGGSAIRQINPDEPISPALNTTMALVFRENFSKLYESEFLRLGVLKKLRGKLETEVNLDLENRVPLVNASLKKGNGKSLSFEENLVFMPYAQSAISGRTVICRIHALADWYPFLRSARYNLEQSFLVSSSPRIRFELVQALPGIMGSSMDFSRVSVSVRHLFALSPVSSLETYARSAFFLHRSRYGQMDVLHLQGNETPFLPGHETEHFRTLPYYRMSGVRPVFEGHLQLTRRSLILGWAVARKRNWRELLIARGLANTGQPSFYEFGYGIDQLLRFFRAEVLYSGFDGKPGFWSLRVGMSTNLRLAPRTFNREPGISAGQ